MFKKQIFSGITFKFVIIGILILILTAITCTIYDVAEERHYSHTEAAKSIIEPLGGSAGFEGLLLFVPYKHIYYNVNNEKVSEEIKYVVFVPDSYKLDIKVDPYFLHRGIYSVPVYNSEIKVEAIFTDLDFASHKIAKENILYNETFIGLGINNKKNITALPKLKANTNDLAFDSTISQANSPFVQSLFYRLHDNFSEEKMVIKGTIYLQGGEMITITPIASDNKISMTSNWKDPSFSGGWLPTSREVNNNGFKASWDIAGISTVFPKSWISYQSFKPEIINTSFMVPVNHYQKTKRSIKYAFIFLVIPFLALLLSEIFSKCRIHPIQYFLIGFANILFYLLLLSISEHLSFNLAYLISSLVVSLTTLLYAKAILNGFKWGGALGGIQLVGYAFLFGLLQSEDYALLAGSLGIFAVTVLFMFVTRKIDWYHLNKKDQEEVKEFKAEP